jgi:hypothetical protein
MRALLRAVLALFTLGMIGGCHRSSPSDPSGDIDAPFQAAFRVPGLT